MTVFVNFNFNINSLEIATVLDVVPVTNRFADGLLAARLLNSIMSNFARNCLASLCKLVVPVNRHELALGNTIRSLEHDRTGFAFAKKILYVYRYVVEIVLRTSRRTTT